MTRYMRQGACHAGRGHLLGSRRARVALGVYSFCLQRSTRVEQAALRPARASAWPTVGQRTACTQRAHSAPARQPQWAP